MLGGRRHPLLLRTALGGLGAAVCLALVGCSTSGGPGPEGTRGDRSLEEPACVVLARPMPDDGLEDPTDTEGPTGSTGGDWLLWLLRALDDEQATVIVYLDPSSTPEDLASLDAEIADRPGVLTTRAIDRDETYEDFQRLFEDQEEMLANVEPGDLPTSVRVEVEGAEADGLVSWAQQRSDVFEVRDTTDVGRQALDAALTKQANRDGWSDLSAWLSSIEGDPGWATTSAATISRLLEDGTDAAPGDPATLTDARHGLEDVLATCGPD